MPPRRGSLRRPLSLPEKKHAMVGTSPAALVRRGLTPKRAHALEREWIAWDAQYGFAWRTLAGVPTPADRDRVDAGEEPGTDSPDPPGLDLVKGRPATGVNS